MLADSLSFLQTIVWFVLALGVLVTFHEFGHYWVARRCGIKVLRFSVGFGKPLYTWINKNGTEFCLAAIPLGGYVKMLDEREGEVPSELLSQAFTQKSVYQRIAVVIAGPVANFILAIGLWWLMFLPGETGLAPIVGKVEPDSIAHVAGLEAGQEIVALDGVATPTRQILLNQLLDRLGESGEIAFSVIYPGSTQVYESVATLDEWQKGVDEPEPFKSLGLKLSLPDVEKIRIAEVQPDLAGSRAGLEKGDELWLEDNPGVEDWASFIAASAGQSLDIVVRRQGQQLPLTLVPEAKPADDGQLRGFIGVAYQIHLQQWPEDMVRHSDYSILAALGRATTETWDKSIFVLKSVKKLITGELSTKNLSGPITIAKVAGATAEAGWMYYVGFLAILSVSLGVFNLLPIPVLDGGHLLYYLIEAVKGSPVPEKVQFVGYQIGLMLVLSLMVLAFYNDIARL